MRILLSVSPWIIVGSLFFISNSNFCQLRARRLWSSTQEYKPYLQRLCRGKFPPQLLILGVPPFEVLVCPLSLGDYAWEGVLCLLFSLCRFPFSHPLEASRALFWILFSWFPCITTVSTSHAYQHHQHHQYLNFSKLDFSTPKFWKTAEESIS